MAYTRAWSSASPLGTRPAKEIDDAIREKMLDLQERINSILATGTTIDTDPLVLNPARIGADPGTPITRYIIVPPYGVGKEDGDNYDQRAGHTLYSATELSLGIVIPVGYKIILFEAYLDKSGNASASAELSGHNMSTGAEVLNTGELTRSAAGIGVVTSAALNYTVTDLNTFRVRCTTSGISTARFYGARITVEIANYGFGY